jgi:hypothetical protein
MEERTMIKRHVVRQDGKEWVGAKLTEEEDALRVIDPVAREKYADALRAGKQVIVSRAEIDWTILDTGS